MYYTNQSNMNLMDGKTAIGIIGTGITAFLQWFSNLFFALLQTEIYAPDWIPLIPATATAIYILAKAYVHVRDGANGVKKSE